MNYSGPKSLNGIKIAIECRLNKETKESEFYLAGERIGHMVTYGKKNMIRPSRNGMRPTVFASRIQWKGLRVEEEGQSPTALKNKVAKAIYDWIKLKAEKKADSETEETKGVAPKM